MNALVREASVRVELAVGLNGGFVMPRDCNARAEAMSDQASSSGTAASSSGTAADPSYGAMAQTLLEQLPDAVVSDLKSDRPSRKLLQVSEAMQTSGLVELDDIRTNCAAIGIVIAHFPDHIPKLTTFASIVVELDACMGGLYLRGGTQARVLQAVNEAATFKLLVQRLRRLARRTKSSRCPIINGLKATVVMKSGADAKAPRYVSACAQDCVVSCCGMCDAR